MPKCELDAIDRRIVTELQANARLSNIELAGADKIGFRHHPACDECGGWSGTAISTATGPPCGVAASGSASRLPRRQDQRPCQRPGASGFERTVVAMPEVVACHLVSGEADYLLEIVVPKLKNYQRFLVDKLLDLARRAGGSRGSIADIQTLKAGARATAGTSLIAMIRLLTPADAASTVRSGWKRSSRIPKLQQHVRTRAGKAPRLVRGAPCSIERRRLRRARARRRSRLPSAGRREDRAQGCSLGHVCAAPCAKIRRGAAPCRRGRGTCHRAS